MKSAEKFSGALVAGLVLLMFAAFFVLRGSAGNLAGNSMNVDRSTFNVVNAVTLTGFQTPHNTDEYTLTYQATVFVLIVAGSVVMLLVSAWALVRILGLQYTDRQIGQSCYFIYALAVLAGAATLIRPGVGLWAAIFQAASAIGNSGLFIGGLTSYRDLQTHLILLPLSVLGGLGVVVLHDFCSSVIHRRRPHSFTLNSLATLAVIYVVGVSVIVTIECFNETSFTSAVILGSTEVLNSRTLGFPLGAFEQLSRASQWVVLVLMMIGANSGGTGGGIKMTTVQIVGRDTFRLLRGKPIGRNLGLACLWVGIYLLITLTTIVLLLSTQPQSTGERLLFLAVSAASNVGISHDPVTISGNGLYILSAAMLAGRFTPLALLWWAAKRND